MQVAMLTSLAVCSCWCEPNDEDLVAYHAEANSRKEAMQAKYDALMAQAEEVSSNVGRISSCGFGTSR